ncbi:MAG: pirin family protein [Alphaproteobacteria bacterium]|nr:pirin family protein [Alphaproteobacteria bacterium]
MADSVIEVLKLGGPPWQTFDPFLFCVHHDDGYPTGNANCGPNASLSGRNIGQDFAGKDGWNMYHGDVVPGFPAHPHRGFETITLARRGFIDHSDSLGARARFGRGDVQWMTAGKGIVHCEMFPLLDQDKPNPVELFQIWMNLPASDKMVDPYFTMFWAHSIPRVTKTDAAGNHTDITVIAGAFDGLAVPAPPPNSWASRPDAEVAIWTVSMEAGARVTLPTASKGVNRTLYFVTGGEVKIDGASLKKGYAARVRPEVANELVNGATPSEVLVLQGRPIGEPVAHYGPFVMNTRAELEQAFDDYRRTRFGGWPWDRNDPIHGRDDGRFAAHANGRKERPA